MRWMKFSAPKTRRLLSIRRFINAASLATCSALLMMSGQALVNVPKVSAAGYINSSNISVSEGSNAVFTFTLAGPNYYSYRYYTSGSSAIQNIDYEYRDGGLDFSCPPQIRCSPKPIDVVVPTINDAVYEPGVDETFTITVISNNNEGGEEVEGTWTASIKDNDPAPTPPTSTTPTPPARPRPTTPTPTPDPTPEPTPEPEPTPIDEPEVLSFTTPTAPSPTPDMPAGPESSAFVKSVADPSQLPTDFGTIAKAVMLAAFLVLLIFFPADLFNGTLQSNYDEVAGWFKLTKLRKLHEHLKLRKLPIAFSVMIYAALAALLNSQLSPDFGWNRASLALLLGMFLALITTATVYDLIRAHYLKRRYSKISRLRTHVIGLVTGGILVTISRMANFLPGYLYGLFTGLVFHEDPTDEQDGEGLAVASVALLALAIGGWFALIPVRTAVASASDNFPLLVLEAGLATLWVSTLGAIVFGLIPLRYLYGEALKKWSKLAWVLIYGSGMILFVYTLLDPAQSFYGKSDKVSLLAVLSLFFGFGIFSVAFWAYFRYRPVRQLPAKKGA